jgi:hypothetical protein
VGWSPYPWSRGAYEAICAEEAIALADTALYRAKGLGRNQGVGILPSDAALTAPEQIDLAAAQDSKSPLARTVRTVCPGWDSASSGLSSAAQHNRSSVETS